MQFDPDKCNILHVTLKRLPIITNYTIHGKQPQTVSSAKYLGLNVDSKLTSTTQMDKMVDKANGIWAMIQCNTQFSPQKTKADAYKTLVTPIAEYASTIWAPHTQKNIQKVESVQCKAACYVMSDWECTSSIMNILQILEWQSLEQHRAQTWVMMLYKIAHNIIGISPSLYFQPAVVRSKDAMRSIIPGLRVSAFQYSFFP